MSGPGLLSPAELMRPPAVAAAYPQRERLFDTGRLGRIGERVIGSGLRWMNRQRLGADAFLALVGQHAPWACELAALPAPQRLAGFAQLCRQLKDARASRRAYTATVARCFALVRETSASTLGLRHHDNQVIAAWLMLRGAVAELATGEGKTLAAVLTAVTAAAAGRQVHVITANDYLAERDCADMLPLYRALGLSVAAVGETMAQPQRIAAWRCAVVYASNKVVAFDHLRDRVAHPEGFLETHSLLGQALHAGQGAAAEQRTLLTGLDFALVDEADSVLIDDAKTPLILSADMPADAASAADEQRRQILALARDCEPGEDFLLVQGDERQLRLTDQGRRRAIGARASLSGPFLHRLALEESLVQALMALHLYRRDEDYVVLDGSCMIVDPTSGRTLPDRKWSHGLQQMVELKEGVDISAGRETLAQISYQRLFQRYLHLGGMSGTAREVAAELGEIYGLMVVPVATHHPVIRHRHPLCIHADEQHKQRAIIERALQLSGQGKPVMVGCRSVLESEQIAAGLVAAGAAVQVLNARQSAQEALIVAAAGQAGALTIATGMAGRGTDIKLSAQGRDAGGLQVIIASPHDSARVDRQFEGRCGRQGDPGAVYRHLSLQDAVLEMSALAQTFLRPFAEGEAGWLRLVVEARLAWARHLRARRARSARYQLMRYDQELGQALAFSGGNR